MVVEVRTIRDEVAAAMRYARKRAGLTPEQMAREVNRVLDVPVPFNEINVSQWEEGVSAPSSLVLVAAARIAEVPVSACLGELEVFTASIPELERRIAALEDKLSSRQS